MNKKIIKIVSIFSIIVLLLISLSTTTKAAASAKVFSNGKSPYANDCSTYSISGLHRLGYTVYSTTGKITRSEMLEWINNTGNGYAMYAHTLGGSGYFNDYEGYSIDSSMISGNWDFVFIDSSYSAQDNTLAKAFKTVGYTNRCFLGWSKIVTFANSDEFNYYFWVEYAGKASIQSIALSAASCVPGSGTTPIKLYGSTTYKGTAR